MGAANVNDRSTIEAIYSREAFEADAARNSLANATVLHGLLIVSEVSASGAFDLQRAKRQVGEGDPLGDTLFLAPFRRDADATMQQNPAYGALEEKPGHVGQATRRNEDYDAFLERVLAAAAGAEFKESIGRHEERLRGFRGG
jgi:hypothetical protein